MEEQDVNAIRSDLEELEQQGDELEQHAGEVDEQIDETREEAERKQQSSEVPGLQEPLEDVESGMSVNAQEPGGAESPEQSADRDSPAEGGEDEAQQSD